MTLASRLRQAAAGSGEGDTTGPPATPQWPGHVPGKLYLGTSEVAGRTTDQTVAEVGAPLGLEREFFINYTSAAAEDAFITGAHAKNRIPWLSYKVSQTDATIQSDWAAIASGSQDSVHTARATRYNAFGRPVIVTFNGQPDRDGSTLAHGADWRAAWKRLAGIYASRANIAFVPIMSDYLWHTLPADGTASGTPTWWLDDEMLALMPFLGLRVDKTTANETYAQRVPPILAWLDGRGFTTKMVGIGLTAGYTTSAQSGAQWWDESWAYAVQNVHRIGAIAYHNTNATPPPAELETPVLPLAPGQPTASAITTTSLTLTWTPAEAPAGDPVLEYKVYRGGVFLKTAGTALSTSATGLTAGTSYTFTVRARNLAGEGPASTPRTVSTTADTTTEPPPPTGSQVVYVAGDIGQMAIYMNNGAQDLTGNMIRNDTTKHAVIAPGDLAYTDGTYAEFMENYDPYWGSFKNITYPAAGNHEYKTLNAGGYKQYMGARATPNGNTWYSFNLGAWHFIALDSNTATSAGSEQMTWLGNDLQAWSTTKATRPGLCAFWHHPRYTSTRGGSSSVASFLTALAPYKVDLILEAHDHAYERFNKINPSGAADANGARHFVIGTGGRGLYPLGTIHPQSAVRIHNQWGVVKFTFTSTNYSWLWRPTSGTSADSGTTTINAK